MKALMYKLHGLICAATVTTLASTCLADEWQMRRLNHPTPTEIGKEQKGQIFIYDGLEERQVNTALEHAFHRMENMMFIRTRYASNESEDALDDGCD